MPSLKLKQAEDETDQAKSTDVVDGRVGQSVTAGLEREACFGRSTACNSGVGDRAVTVAGGQGPIAPERMCIASRVSGEDRMQPRASGWVPPSLRSQERERERRSGVAWPTRMRM